MLYYTRIRMKIWKRRNSIDRSEKASTKAEKDNHIDNRYSLNIAFHILRDFGSQNLKSGASDRRIEKRRPQEPWNCLERWCRDKSTEEASFTKLPPGENDLYPMSGSLLPKALSTSLETELEQNSNLGSTTYNYVTLNQGSSFLNGNNRSSSTSFQGCSENYSDNVLWKSQQEKFPISGS